MFVGINIVSRVSARIFTLGMAGAEKRKTYLTYINNFQSSNVSWEIEEKMVFYCDE